MDTFFNLFHDSALKLGHFFHRLFNFLLKIIAGTFLKKSFYLCTGIKVVFKVAVSPLCKYVLLIVKISHFTQQGLNMPTTSYLSSSCYNWSGVSFNVSESVFVFSIYMILNQYLLCFLK